MKLLLFDIETTGFGRKYDYIIQIAGLVYDTETGEEFDVFNEYAKPGKSIPSKITELTGISNATVVNAQSEKDLVMRFAEFVAIANPDKLGGHNIDAFDMGFIREKTNKYFITFPNLPTIDTLKIARAQKYQTGVSTPTGKVKLTQVVIAASMGITYQAHDALEDVRALKEIYPRLLKSKDELRNDAGF